jgi:DNA polymerase III subunit beta
VLRAVATDGHRLARVEMVLPEGAAGMPGVIVPRKTILELRKLVEESEAEVQIALSPTKIRFAIPDGGGGSSFATEATLTSKLIDGTFPDYDRVIPRDNDKVLEVDCKSFAEAVDRVSTISTEKSRAVKLAIERGSLTLSATSPENGTAVEELEVRYQASPIEIGFNSRYLLDITEQIGGEGAQFVMSDAASPTIVRDSADASALYVLMPMRV